MECLLCHVTANCFLQIEASKIIEGPLIAGVTPAHSVRLFVQRQIEAILKSDAYRADPINGAASDCLLVWQLLEMLVQQQGVCYSFIKKKTVCMTVKNFKDAEFLDCCQNFWSAI